MHFFHTRFFSKSCFFLMVIWLVPLISFAQPTSESISQVLQKEQHNSIIDCYYLNQLYQQCESEEDVYKLFKLLKSELRESNQLKRNSIAIARRLTFLGKHRSAIQRITTIRNSNFSKLNSAIQSEYFDALGYIAMNSGNPKIALSYYQKAARISESTDYIELHQGKLCAVGVAYNANKQPEKAMKVFQNAMALETKGENRNSLYLRLNIALTQLNLGNLENAKATFMEAFPIIKAKKNYYAEIRTLGNIGDIYLKQDSLALATSYYENAQELALQHNQLLDLISINSGLSKAYESAGNTSKALELLKTVNRIESEINDGISESLTAIELQQEISGKEKINKKIKGERDREAELKQFLLYALIAAIAVSILLIVYILRYQGKKRQLFRRELLTTKKSSNREPNKNVEIIEKLEAIIINNERYKQEGLTLDLLAKLIGTNRSYLSEAINTHYEKNFAQWLSGVRIDAAKKLLSDPNQDHISIEGIAKTVGYASISTFNSHFKNETDLTPSYFRKQSQKQTIAKK